MTVYTEDMEVRWTSKATQDLEAHIEHLYKENQQIALKTLQRIHQATRSLSDFPKIGRTKELGLGFRELVVGAYIVGYRLERGVVRILGVHHHAQDRPL